MECIRQSINSISVVEWLSTKSLVKHRIAVKGCAVVNIHVRLNNEDELLARVIEVELDLVGRRTNRLVTSELKLLNEVLMRVLCHAATLVGVKEDVIDVERSSNKGLTVSSRGLNICT